MPFIKVPVKRTSQPQGAVEIDQSNSLAPKSGLWLTDRNLVTGRGVSYGGTGNEPRKIVGRTGQELFTDGKWVQTDLPAAAFTVLTWCVVLDCKAAPTVGSYNSIFQTGQATLNWNHASFSYQGSFTLFNGGGYPTCKFVNGFSVGETVVLHGTYDGSTLRVYRNGVLENSVAAGNSLSGISLNSLQFLGGTGGTAPFNGAASYVSWDTTRALSDAQIKQHADNVWQTLRSQSRSLWIPGTVSGESTYAIPLPARVQRNQQPQDSAPLNWNSGLLVGAKSLISSAHGLRDLVTPRALTRGAGNALVIGTQGELDLNSNVTTAGIYYPGGLDTVIPTTSPLILHMRLYTGTSGGGSHFALADYNAAGSVRQINVELTVSSNLLGVGFGGAQLSGTVTWSVGWHSLTIYQAGTTCLIYVDGKFVSQGTVTARSAAAGGKLRWLGAGDYPDFALEGGGSLLLITEGYWKPELAVQFHANPWQIFAPKPALRWVGISGAATTLISATPGDATAAGLNAAVIRGIAATPGNASAAGTTASVKRTVPGAVGNATAAGVTATVTTTSTTIITGVVGNATAAGIAATVTSASGVTLIAVPASASAAGVTASVTRSIAASIGNAVAAGATATLLKTIGATVGNATAQGLTALIQHSEVIGAAVANAIADGVQATVTTTIVVIKAGHGYARVTLAPKRLGDPYRLVVDFISQLDPGDSVVSCESELETYWGADSVPTLAYSTSPLCAGTKVVQYLAGGQVGSTYKLSLTAHTPSNETAKLTAFLAVTE